MIIKHVCGHEANYDFKDDEVDYIEVIKKSKCRNCLPKEPNNLMELIHNTVQDLAEKRIKSEEDRLYQAKRAAFAVEIGRSLASTVGYDEEKWAAKSVRMTDFLLRELEK